MIRLFVDNKQIETKEGTTLLSACLDNGIYIPNLCYIKERNEPFASCRLCFVEIEGYDAPVASCTVTVSEGMVVSTDTPSVRRLQQRAFRLLLSVHHVDCKKCFANKKCELQKISKFLKIGLKTKKNNSPFKSDLIKKTFSLFDFYPNRCVLCGKCIYACKNVNNGSFLSFAKRGFDTTIIFSYKKNLPPSACIECDKSCVEICPVGAITFNKTSIDK